MKKFAFILLITHCSLQFAQLPTQQWVARYNTPHSENDRFEGMVLDKFGNSYLTGWATDSTNGANIITIKVNSSGQIIWSQVYNSGGPGSNDLGQAIAVDDSGNVYITGYTGLNFGPYDIITIKYDSNANVKWERIYNSGGTEEAFAIKNDNMGNVYITGGTNNGTVLRTITIKYNTFGDTIWVKKYLSGNNSSSYCLDIDKFNNIYISGQVHFTRWVSLILKYNSDGNLVWANTYDNGGDSSPNSITVDSIGNGAITGAYIAPSSFSDYYTVKFTSEGNTLWQKTYNGPGNFEDYGTSVKCDNSGNTYVTGSSWGNDMDYFTIKYDIIGDTVWTKRYNGTANSTDDANSLDIDSIGNCFITGSSKGAGSGYDFCTIKYNQTGNQLWVIRYNGLANSDDRGNSVILSSNNYFYVGGESVGIGTGLDLAVVKYNQSIGIIGNVNEMPSVYKLFQNYPNPFNSTTIITYQLPVESFVNLSLYNSIGQLVDEIVNSVQEVSTYSEVINCNNLSSGIYFYKLIAQSYEKPGIIFSETKKLIIVK